MAVSQAAHLVEKAIGHDDNVTTAQDVFTFPDAGFKRPDECCAQVPKPKIVQGRDVILKMTGSTVWGSYLHLLHGSVLQLSKGDILGHEFCGVAEFVGR
ncbi:hypothetical protein H634G_08147 [Metarhizium anisopliae BRIP 53293]|uniref:Uncharacterized protein n=1 Tax=Metarhizium anisopliae BRIP 53293 TaxID=1291518 RepID=A0A0D9NRH6_METAN|nr:hypothetical protein H634G_08147 [Metarhizium anisopliae BRIP 53293]KJK95232.1 hypothetical protein H633G_00900 [Metarhizium anisopliae BRIP 53284]